MKRIIATVALALAASGATAQPEVWEITMVVDNQFDAYYGTATATDPNGLFGSGTWPTTFTFNVFGRSSTDYLYVATASDHATAQGFLADFENVTTGLTTSTGDAAWEVFPAGAYLREMGFSITTWPRNLMPTQAEVDIAINFATTNSLWITPDTQPGAWNGGPGVVWGQIPNISVGAQWIWHDSTGGGTPLNPGRNHNEFLVFRVPGVPTPGTAMLLGLGGLVAARRRR